MLTPREYQQELIHLVADTNAIITLPTGTLVFETLTFECSSATQLDLSAAVIQAFSLTRALSPQQTLCRKAL
jgi:hypothetical protein